MRETYVYRGGKVIPKSEAPPEKRVSIISDDCEVKSMADGRIYTSKSKLRADYRARGFLEVGSPSDKKHLMCDDRPQRPSVRADVKKAMEQLGYA